jgi:hypothetical protein
MRADGGGEGHDPDGLSWVRDAAAASPHPVQILPCTDDAGRRALEWLQVSARSPLGAIARHTGGLLVDHGWLRVLGAGCDRLPRSLPSWNGSPPRHAAGLLVADDAIGGCFAWFAEPRTIHYFAPDTLCWEDLGLGYADWLEAMLGDELHAFYESLRWPGWEDEVGPLSGDEALLVIPPLPVAGPPLAERPRRPVPMTELWELSQQLAQVPDGAPLAFRVTGE